MNRLTLAVAVCAFVFLPAVPVAAQADRPRSRSIHSGPSAAGAGASGQAAPADDKWEMSFVPLYFWATTLSGQMSVRSTTVPILLEFADAADNLGGAFSFHFEATRRRWGMMTDLNFIRLSSSGPIDVGPVTVERDFQLDNIMFEAAALYYVSPATRIGLIGGLRTYTLSPTIELAGAVTGVSVIDDSRTSANAFGGVVLRPRINEKWALIGRADIGGGNADLTWSAVAGLEFRFKPWASIDFGYKALGIDVKSEDAVVREYDVTHYGPIFGLRMHWTK